MLRTDNSDIKFDFVDNCKVSSWLDADMGAFDLVEYCERQALPTRYDLVIVFTDEDASLFPFNTRSFHCPTVLLLNDTHHFPRPISMMIEYARAEKFDVVVNQFTAHHVHWFGQAGLDCAWVPGLLTKHCPMPIRDTRKDRVAFIGHTWDYHAYRCSMIEEMKRAGIPCDVRKASRAEAARTYAETLISFNCSLNSDINIRNFEVLSSGGFLLTDALPQETGFARLFRPGEACEIYHGRDELMNKIEFYRRHPVAAADIARRGFAHFEAELGPQKAMETFRSVVFEGRDPAATLPPDPRLAHADPNHLQRRLGTYEDLQELHRRKDQAQVLIKEGATWFRAHDVRDLPRLALRSPAAHEDAKVTPISPAAVEHIAWDYVIGD